MDLQFQKPYQIVKSEKYEIFCVSKLLIWRQKWVAGLRHGNLLVVHWVSPGRIIVVLFWTKYAVPHQTKPGILQLTIRRGWSNISIVFIFVSCEKRLLSCCFSRTAQLGGAATICKAGDLSEFLCPIPRGIWWGLNGHLDKSPRVPGVGPRGGRWYLPQKITRVTNKTFV